MATQMEKSELETLHELKSIEPPQWLTPNSSLSATARSASQTIFRLLKPHAAKSPFDQLFINGFDAEQIWQQIDLQSGPLVGLLKREIKRFEKNPNEIKKSFGDRKKVENRESKVCEDFAEEEEEQEERDIDEEEKESEEEGEDWESEEEEEEGEGGGVEDRFLKIKELEEYLEDDEEREYGVKSSEKKKKNKKVLEDDEEEDERGDEDEESEDDDELGEFGLDDGGSEDLENARYEDFFGSNKKKAVKRKSDLIDGSEDSETDDEQEADEKQEDDGATENKKNDTLSTHEKEQLKIQSKIEQLEKANLEGKHWTMQGEVTAAMRPKNSLLEVDLDFEHNVMPPPVITEEITASLEELIQKRILEVRFDDVQRAPSSPSKAPKELTELDDNKSKKGLAEIYEEEYVQKTNQDYVPTTFSDELQKEANMLFKRLCLKLDALSHFHFTPKPVIEDMSIQSNFPALAMEEVAPLAVSDAAMLAPEEVFSGKGGDIKEEAELTQEERKRRRANKKRKFKAEAAKRTTKKSRNDKVSQNASVTTG